jgi:hypothetical protein
MSKETPKEYKTTWGSAAGSGDYGRGEPDDPVRPDGEGWRYLGQCGTNGYLHWFWEREIGDKAG